MPCRLRSGKGWAGGRAESNSLGYGHYHTGSIHGKGTARHTVCPPRMLIEQTDNLHGRHLLKTCYVPGTLLMFKEILFNPHRWGNGLRKVELHVQGHSANTGCISGVSSCVAWIGVPPGASRRRIRTQKWLQMEVVSFPFSMEEAWHSWHSADWGQNAVPSTL